MLEQAETSENIYGNRHEHGKLWVAQPWKSVKTGVAPQKDTFYEFSKRSGF